MIKDPAPQDNLCLAGRVVDRIDVPQHRARLSGEAAPHQPEIERSDEAVSPVFTPDASDLCVNCGLCCNGVLYSTVQVEPEEVTRLEVAGHAVDQIGKHLQYHQPCHHNDHGRCTIYATRYLTCRTFRCALLKRFDAGEVDLSKALEAVAQAKAIVVRVATIDSQSVLLETRVARRQVGTLKQESGSSEAIKLWLESLALDLFLDRTFRNKPVLGTKLEIFATRA